LAERFQAPGRAIAGDGHRRIHLNSFVIKCLRAGGEAVPRLALHAGRHRGRRNAAAPGAWIWTCPLSFAAGICNFTDAAISMRGQKKTISSDMILMRSWPEEQGDW